MASTITDVGVQKREAVAREEERWDKDEAHGLIKRALEHLKKRHLEAGKPDFDPTTVNRAYDRVEEACGAEDMAALRYAVRSVVVVGLKEFRRERGAA